MSKIESLLTATDRSKSVEIAKDVILQLNSKMYTAQSGVYFARENTECEVCAVGSIWASKINLQQGELPTQDRAPIEIYQSAHISSTFGVPLARVMELFFEHWTSHSDTNFLRRKSVSGTCIDKLTTLIDDFHNRAYKLMGDSELFDDLTLRSLMTNIIENNGKLNLNTLLDTVDQVHADLYAV